MFLSHRFNHTLQFPQCVMRFSTSAPLSWPDRGLREPRNEIAWGHGRQGDALDAGRSSIGFEQGGTTRTGVLLKQERFLRTDLSEKMELSCGGGERGIGGCHWVGTDTRRGMEKVGWVNRVTP